MPEKYRDNAKVELAGNLNVRELSDEEIEARLAALSVTMRPADTNLDTHKKDQQEGE